jgi:hypothetical protein
MAFAGAQQQHAVLSAWLSVVLQVLCMLLLLRGLMS